MGSRLRSAVGAIRNIVQARKIHMTDETKVDPTRAIADDRNVQPIAEDPQTIAATPADRVPIEKHEGKQKSEAIDSSGASPASRPQEFSRIATSPPLSPSARSTHSSSGSLSDTSYDPPYETEDENDPIYDMENNVLHRLHVKGYSFETERWSSTSLSGSAPVHSLRVVTWNVDFMAADATGRLACVLDHLKRHVLSGTPKPSCILLQELERESFAELLTNSWVRKNFAISPPNTKRWRARYGVATLVSRDVRVQKAQILQYHRTTMGRTAVLIDIVMRVPGTTDETRIVRIANTHLESLPVGEPSRSVQLCAVAKLLRESGVNGGGLVGGDMNIIGPADESIHLTAGLVDACDDDSAHTWGYQPPSKFPPGRLDRIFYVGQNLVVEPLEVIGKGVTTKKGRWASDHYGLMTTITLRAGY